MENPEGRFSRDMAQFQSNHIFLKVASLLTRKAGVRMNNFRKCLRGWTVSAPDFGSRVWIPLEVRSFPILKVLHCTVPFMFIWLKNLKKGVKPETIHPSILHQNAEFGICTIISQNYSTVLIVSSLARLSHLPKGQVIWATSQENLFYGICKQQRCRSACIFVQSDQCLCCSLPT